MTKFKSTDIAQTLAQAKALVKAGTLCMLTADQVDAVSRENGYLQHAKNYAASWIARKEASKKGITVGQRRRWELVGKKGDIAPSDDTRAFYNELNAKRKAEKEASKSKQATRTSKPKTKAAPVSAELETLVAMQKQMAEQQAVMMKAMAKLLAA